MNALGLSPYACALCAALLLFGVGLWAGLALAENAAQAATARPEAAHSCDVIDARPVRRYTVAGDAR